MANNLNIIAGLKLQMDDKALQTQLLTIKSEIEKKLVISVDLKIRGVEEYKKQLKSVKDATDSATNGNNRKKEMSEIDALILKYKAMHMTKYAFITAATQMSKTDEFTNTTMQQQAKLLGTLESATTSYISAVKRRDAAQKQSVSNMKSSNPSMTSEQINLQLMEQAHGKALAMNAKFDAKKLSDMEKWHGQALNMNAKFEANKLSQIEIANNKVNSIREKALQYEQKVRYANADVKDNASIQAYKNAENALKRIYDIKKQIAEADKNAQYGTSAQLKPQAYQAGLDYIKAHRNISELGLQTSQREVALMQTKLGLQNQLNIATTRQNDNIKIYQQKMQNDIAQMKVGKDKVFLDPRVQSELTNLNTMLANMGRIGGASTKDVSAQMSKLQTMVKQVGFETKQLNKETNGYFANLKMIFGKFSDWMVVGTIFGQSLRQVQAGIKYIYEMDTALTQLSKVVDLTDVQLNDMRISAMEMGKALAISSVEVMKSMAEFGRLVKNPEEIKLLTNAALMAANVTSLTADQAAKSISTAMIAFKFEAKDAITVIDKWNELNFVAPCAVMYMQ